jgi:murein DD-endopeptidase MepM/ murein hydrolase activator NlpD
MLAGVTWPLVSNVIRKNKLSNTFGMVRVKPDGSPKPHQGWDFAAAVGTTVYAIADGKVVFVTNGGDYGLQVCMSFKVQGQTRYAFYAHLQQASVTVGKEVKMNDPIGTTGKTGNASNLPADEDHLHFEIRTQAYCGLGLAGRVSPLTIFQVCPLNAAITG